MWRSEKKLFLCLMCYLLTSCAYVLTDALSIDETPNQDFAYVYGRFSVISSSDTLSSLNLQSPGGIALQLHSSETKKNTAKYTLNFESEDPVRLFAVKPGEYTWGKLLFTRGFKIQSSKTITLDGELVHLTFEANHAYYLGDYTGVVSIKFTPGSFRYTWQLDSIVSEFSNTSNDIRKKYKYFSSIKMIDATRQLIQRQRGNVALSRSEIKVSN